jgi:hypothetical protein
LIGDIFRKAIKLLVMSRFRIYQVDHYDPKLLGKRIKRLTIILGSIYALFMLTLQIGINIIHPNFDLALFLAIPFLGLYIYLYFKIRKRLNKIKTIGDIEFTRTSIRKRIGDAITEYDYQTIEHLELQKHIPAVNRSSKSGYFSYILRIVFLNSSSESLIVSDKPTDAKRNLSILDTMNTLKKIIQPEVKIL